MQELLATFFWKKEPLLCIFLIFLSKRNLGRWIVIFQEINVFSKNQQLFFRKSTCFPKINSYFSKNQRVFQKSTVIFQRSTTFSRTWAITQSPSKRTQVPSSFGTGFCQFSVLIPNCRMIINESDELPQMESSYRISLYSSSFLFTAQFLLESDDQSSQFVNPENQAKANKNHHKNTSAPEQGNDPPGQKMPFRMPLKPLMTPVSSRAGNHRQHQNDPGKFHSSGKRHPPKFLP